MGAVKGEAIELPPFLDPAAANAGPMSREGRGPIRLSRLLLLLLPKDARIIEKEEYPLNLDELRGQRSLRE